MTDEKVMTDSEIKAMHLADANKALKDPKTNQYRKECLLEFITMIETGKTDHINVFEDGKRIEHFK